MFDRTVYELYEALHQRRIESAKQFRFETTFSSRERKRSIPIHNVLKQVLALLSSFNYGRRQEIPASRGLYPYPPYKRC